MTCSGCSGAVERIAGKIPGVTNVATNIETKQVLVTGGDQAVIETKLMKWGSASNKEVRYVGSR
jgi:copper chaperone CopZ